MKDAQLTDLKNFISDRFAQTDASIAQVDSRIIQTDSRVISLDRRLTQVATHLAQVETRLLKEINDLRTETRAGFAGVADAVESAQHRSDERDGVVDARFARLEQRLAS